MTPRPTRKRGLNTATGGAKRFCYFNLRDSKHIHCFGLFHFFLIQNAVPMKLSYWSILPVLLNFIVRVVFGASEEQMVWIATPSNIAPMKNVRAFWDGTIGKFKRNTVGARMLSFMFTLAISCLGINRFLPQPAVIFTPDVNIAPKTLLRRWLISPSLFRAFNPPLNPLFVSFHKLIRHITPIGVN